MESARISSRLLLVSMCMFGACCGRRDDVLLDYKSWETRTQRAWASMGDGSNVVPPLDAFFVQNGMSTTDTVTLVVFPPVGPEPKASAKAADANLSVTILTPTVRVVSMQDLLIRPLGRSIRVEVRGLLPDTAYSLRVRLGADSADVAIRTAPDVSGEPVSLLLASCNEPWSWPGEDGAAEFPKVAVSSANGLRLLDLRATGQMPVEIGDTTFPSPSLLLGLGDQAYVDAEPTHPGSIALFGGPHSDRLRVKVAAAREWELYLERIYRLHFKIPSFHRVLSSLPSAMVWDDHEIRDGWGTHGDESEHMLAGSEDGGSASLSPRTWPVYFEAAWRTALAFEFARNPGLTGPEYDTQFDWGPRVRVFLMDTRSARSTSRRAIGGAFVPEQPIFSRAQATRLQTWLSACGATPSAFVLGVPVPITLGHETLPAAFANDVKADELADDYHDGWWWPAHDAQRQWLLTLLDQHHDRCPNDRLVIVSGDLHESGLYALPDPTGEIMAYEVISSGISTLTGESGLIPKIKAEITPVGTGVMGGARQVGRVGMGASFAELFFEFPKAESGRELPPPVVRTLFYATTDADENQDMNARLVNLAPALQGKPWKTNTISTSSIFDGRGSVFVTREAAAVTLDYDATLPEKGSNFGLSSASVRCRSNVPDVLSDRESANDWSVIRRVAAADCPCRAGSECTCRPTTSITCEPLEATQPRAK